MVLEVVLLNEVAVAGCIFPVETVTEVPLILSARQRMNCQNMQYKLLRLLEHISQ